MCDSCSVPIKVFQPFSLEEVRKYSGEELAELAKDFQWDKQQMEKIADELFSDGTTLSRIAHLLVFAEMLIDRQPDEKLTIYETTVKSIARNLCF